MKSNEPLIICQYNGCLNSSLTHEMELVDKDDNVYVCSDCIDKFNPEATGHCGLSCKLGYGCDQSC